MIDRVGIELQRDRVRAVALGRFGAAVRGTYDVAWDAERPADAVDALAAHFGRVRRVSLAVGLGFLDVARVSLPPLAAADRRRALALDAARHFAVDEPLVVSLLGDAPPSPDGAEPAFAAPRGLVERWVAAFGAWANVDCVEPAPASLARALAGASLADAAYELPAGDDEVGVVELHAGRVARVRRIPRIALSDEPSGASGTPRALPSHRGVTGEWLVAWGAALGVGQSADVLLVDDATAHGIAARRTRRVAVAAVACGLALGAALVSADRARDRKLAAVDDAIAAAVSRAAPAESLQARIVTLDAASREADRIAARRTDALAVLAALGERLPADAVVQSLRAQGDAWQIDGTARSAAAVVPLLDGDARFADVRAAAPSSRFEGVGPARETFSVTFRARPAAAGATR